MRLVNINDIPEKPRSSPKGRFASSSVAVSEALGRDPLSTDSLRRHPFDLEIRRIADGKALCPYHSHSAQLEMYLVISGRGVVRHEEGETPVAAGDAFLFMPGEPHQITAGPGEDLLVHIIADNPVGESCHYPDSGKWIVQSPERRVMRSEDLPLYDGEE